MDCFCFVTPLNHIKNIVIVIVIVALGWFIFTMLGGFCFAFLGANPKQN